MSQRKKKGLVVLGVILSLALLVSACAQTMSSSDQGQQVVYPTVLVKQFVTQVVATPTVAPTPIPEEPVPAVVAKPAANGEWDPYSAPIYYPIPGCVASRLHKGDVAFVANGAGTMSIFQTKDIGFAPIYRHLNAGELMDIIQGPWCDRGAVTWKIASADGYVGFVPEGDGSVYWLLPMPPDTDRVLSKEELRIRQLVLPGGTLSISGNGRSNCR
jgi:hypothetical protein